MFCIICYLCILYYIYNQIVHYNPCFIFYINKYIYIYILYIYIYYIYIYIYIYYVYIYIYIHIEKEHKFDRFSNIGNKPTNQLTNLMVIHFREDIFLAVISKFLENGYGFYYTASILKRLLQLISSSISAVL